MISNIPFLLDIWKLKNDLQFGNMGLLACNYLFCLEDYVSELPVFQKLQNSLNATFRKIIGNISCL